ncbi:50S ribosomal protein L9 [Candidatus Dependentiae bacterium]|nr:50S ribosomal protein L9 [Candidatus Dependentiae bacterium]
MKVFLLKDIPSVGMAGEIVKVKPGYATNFLLPRKLGVEITKKNESIFAERQKVIEHRSEVIATETSMLAEKIKALTLILREKVHGDGDNEGKQKLYGAISASEIVDALATKGIRISKSQVEFSKSIKTTGTFEVTIKLSSRLKPKVTIKVMSE